MLCINKLKQSADHKQPPPPLTANVHFPEGLEVHNKTQDTPDERNYRRATILVTMLSLGAFVVYAYVVYLQFDAANRSAIAAEKANQLSSDSERPWFGATLSVAGFEVGKIPVATTFFLNSGRRPAVVAHAGIQADWFDVFPANPTYKPMSASSGISVPNTGVLSKLNLLNHALTKPELAEATAGVPKKFFIYGRVEYVDVATGITHHTHACWVYIGNDPALTKGFYNCDTYQDAD